MASKKKQKARKKSAEKPVEAKGYLPIDGIAPKTYPALDKMCEDYLALERKAHKAGLEKKEKHLQLMEGLKDRELSFYRCEAVGQVFELDNTEKVKHKNLSDETKSKSAKNAEKNGINPPDDSDDDGGEEELSEKLEE